MSKARRQMPASRFKAECLSLLDDVKRNREVIVITKRGKPVAKLVPVDEPANDSLLGSVTFHGDIVAPLDDAWDVDR